MLYVDSDSVCKVKILGESHSRSRAASTGFEAQYLRFILAGEHAVELFQRKLEHALLSLYRRLQLASSYNLDLLGVGYC